MHKVPEESRLAAGKPSMPVAPERIVGELEQLTRLLVRRVESTSAAAIAAQGRWSLALPGGSVAESFLSPLADAAIDWSRVLVFWIDERAGAADGPDSNYRLAQESGLLERIDPARVYRMPAEATDLERAARRYAVLLVQLLGTPPVIDVALLGAGPDGHVASLFPGHPLLQDESRYVAAVLDSPKPPPGRLTMTLPTLTAAGTVIIGAVGETKGNAVGDAVSNPRSRSPLALVLQRAPRTILMLDPDCARAAGIAIDD